MRTSPRTFAWRGAWLIAATYFYFLIFAQFGFLGILKGSPGLTEMSLRQTMAAMGLGGILGSLITPQLWRRFSAQRLMQGGLGICAAAAGLAASMPRPSGLALGGMATCTGLGLGVLTVTLVASLRQMLPVNRCGLLVGLGTGSAYFLCNVPWIFQASPLVQAALAAGVAALTALAVPPVPGAASGPSLTLPHPPRAALSSSHALWLFLVLIWFDSAAFYIIQNAPPLSEATWSGSALLWRNAWVHFGTALLTGILLFRLRLVHWLVGAFGILAVAGWFVNQDYTRPVGGLLYPIGVSLYSVCLVAFPAFLSGRQEPLGIARQAALLYAVAGWIGSALGIGMAENLKLIPGPFILGTALLLAFVLAQSFWQSRVRELLVAGGVVAVARAVFIVHQAALGGEAGISDPAVLGHQVYLSEGCIHCHSQYIRPQTRDVAMWGPYLEPESIQTNRPPLFGNRRQGPDLLQVGNRRSRAWLKQHFKDPPSLSHHSIMPSYAHLFGDERGEALLDFLTAHGRETMAERVETARQWEPKFSAPEAGVLSRGTVLFQDHCARCHGPEGRGQGALSLQFPRPNGPLREGRFVYAPASLDAVEQQAQLARLIRFGLPGTHMPGHEFLPESDIAALAALVATWSREPGL